MTVPKSKRSGGPKTPAGKAASAKNSVKHGAYATDIAQLPIESFRATFEAFTQTLLDELKPRGPTQQIVARQIAHEAWRMKQLGMYEQLTLEGISQIKPTAKEVHDELGLDWPSWQVPLLDEDLTDLLKLIVDDPLLRMLKRLKDFYLHNDILTMQEKDPDLYTETLGLVSRVAREQPRGSPEYDITIVLMRVQYLGINALRELFPEKELALAEARIWVWKHAEEIGEAMARCVQRRTLQAITNPNLLRARTTINKTFFALMDQYRELQKHDAIELPA